MRTLTVGLVAALLLPGLLLSAPDPVLGAADVLYDFEGGTSEWFVASGPSSLRSVASPRTSGAAAVQISYDLRQASQTQIATVTTGRVIPGLPRAVSLDVHGDGSWNVLWLQLRDATGEIHHLKLGNISFTGWQTLRVLPGTTAPVTTLSGDADGILDLPISVYRLVLDRNPGGTKQVSAIVVDRLVAEYEQWSPLRVEPWRFSPAAGQTGTLRMGLADPASFGVVLTDGVARSRSWSGSLSSGGQASLKWDGRDDAGQLMHGAIHARVTLTRGSAVARFDMPYLAGLPKRFEPRLPGSPVGINATLTTINTDRRAVAAQHARWMEDAYVRTVREEFDWNRVEPRRGYFDWPKFDQAVELARAHNIEILGKLAYSAAWASSAPAGTDASHVPYYPPKNVADFANYARAVVARYKDRIKHWEIWNEENSGAFWKPAPSPAQYAALLKATYAAIKAEDPQATVMLGGTVGMDRTYLDGLVAAGAWSSFDVLAIHTYVAGRPEAGQMGAWIANARAYVSKRGHKPIWITEFGWSTYSGSGSGYDGVTEGNQADYLARGYLEAVRQGVERIFVYNLVEDGSSTTSKLHNYGLIETTGRLKPAYGALRSVANLLNQATGMGFTDPSAAVRKRVDGVESATGWKAHPLGGGTASIRSVSARHGGAASLRLDYAFTSSSTGVELVRNLKLPGSPSSVSVWVHGDDSANPVHLKLVDAKGEVFQAAVGPLMKQWQRMTLYLDGGNPNWKASGGDGRLDYPLTLASIFVFRGGIGQLSGVAHIDDIEVGYGPPVRGLAVSRGNGILHSMYVLANSAVQSVPVSGARAWRTDGVSATSLTVVGGHASVTLGPRPVNVLTTPGGGPDSIAAGSGTASLTWVGGDRTRYTFQILGPGGQVVRNVATDVHVDAGRRSVAWDGRIGGSPAPPGQYRLRVAVIGPDGRVSYLSRVVTVH